MEYYEKPYTNENNLQERPIVENSPLITRMFSKAKAKASAVAKKALVTSALIASLALPSYALAQTRQTLADEPFTGNVITRNYMAEDQNKWEIVNEKLQVKDFDADWGDVDNVWGYTRYAIIDDSLVLQMKEKNASIEADFEVSGWNSDQQQYGFAIGDPTPGKNGTYRKIGINAHPGVGKALIWIYTASPGSNYLHFDALTNILAPGTTNFKMKFWHDTNGYHLAADEKMGEGYKELESELTTKMNQRLKTIEGYPIIFSKDVITDAHTSTTTSIDNIFIEADATGGGGSVTSRKRVNLLGKGGEKVGRQLTPEEIPHRFTRADSNMDKTHDLSDAINTLSYCFLGSGNVPCPDAADVDDNGRIEITDAILSLNALFLDPSIKIPSPNAIEKDGKLTGDAAEGIDTTEDKLPPCQGYTTSTSSTTFSRN